MLGQQILTPDDGGCWEVAGLDLNQIVDIADVSSVLEAHNIAVGSPAPPEHQRQENPAQNVAVELRQCEKGAEAMLAYIDRGNGTPGAHDFPNLVVSQQPSKVLIGSEYVERGVEADEQNLLAE